MSDPQTLDQLWRYVTQRFTAAKLETPSLDARLLLQYATGLTQTKLAINGQEIAPAAIVQDMQDLMAQRLAGAPVANIIGEKEFWGRAFIVSDDVLDPRPDSETLIEAALEKLPPKAASKLLDLGIGSGALLLTLLAERPQASGIGIDKSTAALAIARRNAHELGVRGRVALRHGDWFGGLKKGAEKFDMIVSNPPYIGDAEMQELAKEVRLHDPHLALHGGADGLAPYRILAAQAADYLKNRGNIILEIGPTQGAQVSSMLAASGFQGLETRQDLAGRDRVILAQKPPKNG